MKRTYKRLAALLLACTLLVGLPATLAGATEPVPTASPDPTGQQLEVGQNQPDASPDPAQPSTVPAYTPDALQSNTLTVTPGSMPEDEDLTAELAAANVVVDLYQVASADGLTERGDINYKLGDLYTGLADDLDAILHPAESAEPSELLREMSARAALAALEFDADGMPAQDEDGHVSFAATPYKQGMATKEQITGIEPGLYLVVARSGADPDAPYLEIVRDADNVQIVVTRVHAENHYFIYQPLLVFIPGNTAETGWIHDVEMTLKPQTADGRVGSLRVTKTLTDFVADHPGVFVFRVDVYKPNGELDAEHSTLFDLYFTEDGSQDYLIEDIPEGSRVVVTEEYSGASYELSSDKTLEGNIINGEELGMTFTNHGSTGDGGALRNHFSYNADTGWQLHQEKQPE